LWRVVRRKTVVSWGTNLTLNLSVLGNDGKPEKTISMSLEVHAGLIDAVTKHNFWTLNKLTNYYSNDVLFGFEEFDELLEQINLFKKKGSQDRCVNFFSNLKN
jgi:hypothetical protein